jgi:hypothetical protein
VELQVILVVANVVQVVVVVRLVMAAEPLI